MASLPSPQQLRYLVALHALQHFGRAAEACAVSQSTLSAGILALERQLGCRLLDREPGKHVLFTRHGSLLVERAQEALASLETLVETAAQAGRSVSGPLRLGVIPTIGPFLLPWLMPAVRETFPNLKLYLREDTTERLLARIEAGRLDVAVVALPCGCGTAETLAVKRDELLVALPPDHPLAGQDHIPVGALSGERMLLMEDGHCLRDQVLSTCGVSPGSAGAEQFAATSLHTLVQMVAGGLGITLLPRMAVAAGVGSGATIELRPLAGRGAWRTIALAWQPRSARESDYRALAPLLASKI